MAREKIKVFVSSVVYGFEDSISQICATINSFKSKNNEYEVWNSHIGTIYNPPGCKIKESCLKAVNECDYFLGIILPRYGSGITHVEFSLAIKLNKPRVFLSHFSVRYAREILAQYMYSDREGRVKNPAFKFEKTGVFEDSRIIDMYNEAIQDDQPVGSRQWAQEFGYKKGDELLFVETTFRNIDRFKEDLVNLKKLKEGPI